MFQAFKASSPILSKAETSQSVRRGRLPARRRGAFGPCRRDRRRDHAKRAGQAAGVLQEGFSLDAAATEALIAKATAAEHESVDLYHFTHPLNRSLNEAGRARIVEMMWQIVYADGRRDELEDNLLWRAADLLGVSPRERIELRRRVGGSDDTEQSDEGGKGRRAGRRRDAGRADHRSFGGHRRRTGAGLCRAGPELGAGGAARKTGSRRWPTNRRCGPAAADGAGARSRAARCGGGARRGFGGARVSNPPMWSTMPVSV